jgi:hypothetical protein
VKTGRQSSVTSSPQRDLKVWLALFDEINVPCRPRFGAFEEIEIETPNGTCLTLGDRESCRAWWDHIAYGGALTTGAEVGANRG